MLRFARGVFLAVRDITAALSLGDFRRIWLGNLAASFAMNMQMLARGWLVYTLTASALDLAWVMLSFTVPQILLSLWGGVVADRWPKKTVLFAAQLLNGVATLAMAAIILAERVEFWDFIWFGAFNGAVLALSIPARNAYLADLVAERQYITAMALNTTGMNLARIVAPMFAGVLIALLADGDTGSHFGVGVVYLVIAGLYLVAALATLLVAKAGAPHARAGASRPLDDIAEGLRYVLANPPVLALILLSVVPFLFGWTLNTLIPAFNEDILGGGPDDLGFLMSAMGIGAIVGSLMLAAAGNFRRKGAWVIGTCFAWAAATVAFGASTGLVAATVSVAAYGWLTSVNMSLNRGLVSTVVEPRMRGRVLSIDMMSHGLMPLGVVPISLLAEASNVAVALMVSGGVFALSVACLLALSPSVRRIDRWLRVRDRYASAPRFR